MLLPELLIHQVTPQLTPDQPSTVLRRLYYVTSTRTSQHPYTSGAAGNYTRQHELRRYTYG